MVVGFAGVLIFRLTWVHTAERKYKAGDADVPRYRTSHDGQHHSAELTPMGVPTVPADYQPEVTRPPDYLSEGMMSLAPTAVPTADSASCNFSKVAHSAVNLHDITSFHVSSAELCQQKCVESPGCTAFTWPGCQYVLPLQPQCFVIALVTLFAAASSRATNMSNRPSMTRLSNRETV